MRLEPNNVKMPIMPRMTFSMVADYLGMIDHRTVETWCKNHDVFYAKDDNSIYYVIEQEFLYKANLKAVKVFKEKYGENWQEVLIGNEEPKKEEQVTTSLLGKRKYKANTSEAKAFGDKWSHL